MTTLSKKERWVFAVFLPIGVLAVGYVLVMGTAHGRGSSIGFRAIGTLIAFPVVISCTFLLNLLIALPLKKSRFSSFAVGMIVPVLACIIEYAYLWQVWREYPDIS